MVSGQQRKSALFINLGVKCADQADLPSLTAIAEGNLMEKKRKRDKKRLVQEENSKGGSHISNGNFRLQ